MTISDAEFFPDGSDGDWTVLFELGTRATVAPGEVLATARAGTAVLLIDGDVTVETPDGRAVGAVAGSGLLNEDSLFADGPPAVVHRADGACDVLVLRREDLDELRHDRADLAARLDQALAASLARRVRVLTQLVTDAGDQDPVA